MLDVLGRDYIVDHLTEFMRKYRHKRLYERYVTDGIYAISKTVSHAFSGTSLVERFEDIINPPKEETRTADEIITKITDKLKAMG